MGTRTKVTITPAHVARALAAVDGAIFLTAAGTVVAGSQLYPRGEILALASDLDRDASHDATRLHGAARALTTRVRRAAGARV